MNTPSSNCHYIIYGIATAIVWNLLFVLLLFIAFSAQQRSIYDTLWDTASARISTLSMAFVLSVTWFVIGYFSCKRLPTSQAPCKEEDSSPNEQRVDKEHSKPCRPKGTHPSYIALVACVPLYLIECTKSAEASGVDFIVVISLLAATAILYALLCRLKQKTAQASRQTQ